MKTFVRIVLGLILLIVVTVVVAPFVIDPNDYRDQIQQVVKEKTGRDLLINGDLSLSVFPWVGVGINDVSLSNAEGFKAKHFAEIKEANVKVKLLPLLSQQVEVSTVVLKGVSLNLEKNKAGKTNWDDMAQAPAEQDTPSDTATDASSGAAFGAIAVEVGICGQAPSDYPEFAEFLVDCGIDSISLNPDSVLEATQHISSSENTR